MVYYRGLNTWHRLASYTHASSLLALVLRSQALCLASDTSLARLPERTLLTRVRQVGVLLRHGLGRRGHLARHALGDGLEVGSAVCCGLGGGIDRAC